jgi:hypothetical protein
MIDLNQPAEAADRTLSILRDGGKFVSSLLTALNVADRLTLLYLIFTTTLIVVCRQNVKHWETLLPIHLGLMLTITGLALARRRGVRVLSFMSHWYQVLICLFFF